MYSFYIFCIAPVSTHGKLAATTTTAVATKTTTVCFRGVHYHGSTAIHTAAMMIVLNHQGSLRHAHSVSPIDKKKNI